MNKQWFIFGLCFLVLGFTANYYLNGSAEAAKTQGIELTSGDNQKVSIFDTQDPRVRIVYFGFTRCPDVCPTSLAMLSASLHQIDENERKHIRPMFITLDPERDSGDDAQQYAHYFHKDIEGFSGDLDQIQALADKYNVIFRKTELKDSELKYTIDHSSYFYFLAPNGDLIKKVPHTVDPQPLIQAIQELKTKDE